MRIDEVIHACALGLLEDNPGLSYKQIHEQLLRYTTHEMASDIIIFCNRIRGEGFDAAMVKTFFKPRHFISWAFGSNEFSKCEDALDAWNARHGEKYCLGEEQPVLIDIFEMLRVWREEAEVIA